MLAASLPAVTGAESLELQLSCAARQNGVAEMMLSFLLSSTHGDETLSHRLLKLTAASTSLQTERCEGPELALKSAWQLALALGGSPSIERTADQKVRLQISLPLVAGLIFSDSSRTLSVNCAQPESSS